VSGRLRLLLAGAGTIGRAHAERVLASDAFVLAGIADPSPAGAAHAAGLGVPHWRDLDAALDVLKPTGGRPVAAPAATFRRGDSPHRDAARQRARRYPHAAGHTGDRGGGGEPATRSMRQHGGLN
jgi:hypothetical protein